MSRYKKASYNEQELPAIDGITVVLRPNRDERMKVIEAFLDQQKSKSLNLGLAKDTLTEVLYNSLFLWEDNKRTDKKEVGSEDVTKEDVEDFVVDNIMELWLEVLGALKIIDKSKLKQLAEEQKQEALKAKNIPN